MTVLMNPELLNIPDIVLTNRPFLVNRCEGALKKAQSTNKERDWARFLHLWSEASEVCRQYITDLINSDPSGNKRLGALMKSLRCDQVGVTSL